MDRVVIVGLGLIGGSLGLALKAAKLKNVEIVGFDVSYDAVNLARRRGAVDSTERDIERAVGPAHLVVIATPIMAVAQVLQGIAPYLREGAVVTDVGSTKKQIIEWASSQLPDHVSFVGGHPMAGKETGGIENASPSLFQGSTWCVLPTRSATKQAVELVAGLATTVGATPYFIDGEEHDMMVAGISHLPLLLSSALVKTASASPSWSELAKLASTGFRDVSRLASGEAELARGISLTNQAGLLHWLDAYLSTLLDWRKALTEDPERLLADIAVAREARDRWVAGKAERSLAPETEIPTAGEQMAELFMGSRLARSLKEQNERLEHEEQQPRRGGEPPAGRQ